MRIVEEVPGSIAYVTHGGIEVERTTTQISLEGAIQPIIDALDTRLGVLLASGFEFPGRYTRWDIGFVSPPIQIVSRGREFQVRALNDRGRVLLPLVETALGNLAELAGCRREGDVIFGKVANPSRYFLEEERSRQPSIFSVIRGLIDLFRSDKDPYLGLYGAFGYDLAFQFEPLEFHLERPDSQRDLVVFLPDQLTIVDHNRQVALRHEYEFRRGESSTLGLPRDGVATPFVGVTSVERTRDHEHGEFAEVVRAAHAWFQRGDLFEVVPGQVFLEPCVAPPSELFRRLRKRNPAPYGALMNLGDHEYLVSASPEMYVRVDGRRLETCPISGTISRGEDPIGDAEQILELLSSIKEKSELTMCTDVDRNDKSRICEPGSVKVLGRRQIEMYSRVIHTVDHVEGILRQEFDALDGFLSHTWAVTVTGAPKLWAMRFIEQHERSCRAWYGGAIGLLGFDGNINTGLTLRTIRIKDGVAEVRVGATLLIDSDPDAEERETELKAQALLEAIRDKALATKVRRPSSQVGAGLRVLLVDHEDSFVNTLAGYVRQTGASVETVRGTPDARPYLLDRIAQGRPDLMVLSPGPGTPTDFQIRATIDAALKRSIPIFGVCLGLQALVEYFGGKLATLAYPMHGKESVIRVLGGRMFDELPSELSVGRYHSLHAERASIPSQLVVTSETEDGVVMSIEHRTLPIAAVQFHPESIMSLKHDSGHRIIENVLQWLPQNRP